MKILNYGIALSFSMVIGGYLLEYLTRMVISQYLSIADLGYFSTGLSISYLFMTISLIGLPNDFSKRREVGENGVRFGSVILLFSFIALSFATLLSVLFIDFVSKWKDFIFLAVLMGLVRLSVIRFSIFDKRTTGLFYQEIVSRLFRLCAVLIIIAVSGLTLYNDLGKMLSMGYFVLLLLLFMQHKRIGLVEFKASFTQMKALIVTSLPLAIGVFSQVSAGRVEFLLADLLLDNQMEMLGIFSIYLIFSQILMMPSSVVTFSLTPKISRSFEIGDASEVRRLVISAMKRNAFYSFLLYLFFILFGSVLVDILFGVTNQFDKLYFVLLMTGYMAFAVYSPLVNYLIGIGKYKTYTRASLLSLLVRILMISVLLMQGWGILALCIGSLVSYLAFFLLMARSSRGLFFA